MAINMDGYEENMELQRVVGLVEEEEWGVAPEIRAPDFHIEVTKSSISIDGDPLELESGLSRDLRTVRTGPYVPNPEFEGVAELKTIGHFLKGALGEYVFTEGNPGEMNTHEIYGLNNMLLPSFTLYGHMDLFAKEVTGFMIDEFGIEVSDEWMHISVKGVAKKDTKTDGVPAPTELKLIKSAIPLAFYDVSLEFDGEVPAGVISSFSWNLKNNLSPDKARGLGSRFLQKKPIAGKRESEMELETSLEPETLKYIEMFEYGEEGANTASECKLTTVPLKIVISACERPDEKLTILFPDNLCTIEYDASGSDMIEPKITMKSLATTNTTLKDGETEVMAGVVCTLENNMPEIRPGGIDMLIEPVAAFSGIPLSGEAPLTVQFTNTSIGEGNSYVWDFGDDSPTVTTVNPQHTYTDAGSYTVSLTAINSEGENTETKTGYITVTGGD